MGKRSTDAAISSHTLQALLPLTRWKASRRISLSRLLSSVNGGHGLCALAGRRPLWTVRASSWAPGASSKGAPAQLKSVCSLLRAPPTPPGNKSLASWCSEPRFLPGLFPHKYFLITRRNMVLPVPSDQRQCESQITPLRSCVWFPVVTGSISHIFTHNGSPQTSLFWSKRMSS